jgi:hypothetical protein
MKLTMAGAVLDLRAERGGDPATTSSRLEKARTGLRLDKPASEIDTLARVEQLHERRLGRTVPLVDIAEVAEVGPAR